METDFYSKVILGIVAVCLVLLVAQGFGLAPKPGTVRSLAAAGAPDSRGAEERFKLIPVPMGRVVFRIDTQTGETWRAVFPAGKAWTFIQESDGAEDLSEAVESPQARRDAGVEVPPQADAPVRAGETPAPTD